MPVKTKTWKGTGLEAIRFIWSQNFHRRHLNSSQVSMANSKRQKMMNVYAPVKIDAEKREKAGKGAGGSGGRGRKKNPSQQIDEGLGRSDREPTPSAPRIPAPTALTSI